MNRDGFFDNLRREGGGSSDEIRALRQLAFEERVIKRVFSECGVKMSGWGRLANECREKTGQHKLNFAWFNNSPSFGSFPAWLSGARIAKIHELQLSDLFKPMAGNRLVRALARGLQRDESIPLDDDFAFVFPITRKMFVAHNMGIVARDSGVRWLIRDAEQSPPLLVVEPIWSFCRAISSG